MYGNKIRYLASVFVDADSITSTADNISGLLKALDDENFVPVSLQEQSKPRMAFATHGGEWQLLLLSNRFDISHHPTMVDGSNLGEFSDFCQSAIAKLKVPLKYFKKTGHRLSAVQEGLLSELPKRKMNEIAMRLLKLPGTYSKSLPFEWDWRTVSLVERSFGGLKEPTNTITTIKRWPGTLAVPSNEGGQKKIQRLDRIRVEFDINTEPSNVVARFDEPQITDFFKQSASWHKKLSSEIFSFILQETH